MVARRFVGLLVGGFVSLAVAGAASAATIVNCIGEQSTITTEGITGRADLWPQQLGTMLGATYTVNNDALNGGTVSGGTAKTASSLTGPPAIVIIGPFAEHDYGAGNDLTLAAWQADYKTLVDAYLALTPAPTVYVMTPPPAAFPYQSAAEVTFATDVVKPAVLAVAAGGNAPGKTLKVIDLFTDAALGTTADYAGDGHFNPAGMTEVATLAYKCVAMGMCGAGTSAGTGGAGGGGGAGGASGAGGAGGMSGSITAGAGGATGTGGMGGATGRGVVRRARAARRQAQREPAGDGRHDGRRRRDDRHRRHDGRGRRDDRHRRRHRRAHGRRDDGHEWSACPARTTASGSGDGTVGTGVTSTGWTAGTSGTRRRRFPDSSSGGGCSVGGRSAMGALASLLVAMALAVPAWRRRRRQARSP